jgi:hypothetical protein
VVILDDGWHVCITTLVPRVLDPSIQCALLLSVIWTIMRLLDEVSNNDGFVVPTDEKNSSDGSMDSY